MRPMETGAYTLSGNTGIITVNPGATVYIPSEDEWYKAAYYNGGTSTYSLYPNGQNSITTADANYNNSVGHSTDVGSYGGDPSSYGTFDQGGNVWEWNDRVYSGSSGLLRGQRGGSWYNLGGPLYSAYGFYSVPSQETFDLGFRVASVPEPSYVVLSILASGVLVIHRKR
ncbi:MAG: SUMF1/EgtB/PvdO family nonheme iron enzyme [Verrucomicrobia bacterium]|nr:SUMF1/EgtB/PvdO family nonheme iron enzyme [Verrucomicrobiota bacterium]